MEKLAQNQVKSLKTEKLVKFGSNTNLLSKSSQVNTLSATPPEETHGESVNRKQLEETDEYDTF